MCIRDSLSTGGMEVLAAKPLPPAAALHISFQLPGKMCIRDRSIGAINFEHIRAYVDDIVTVTEDEIRQTLRLLSANAKTVAEPSGAVAPAAFLFRASQLPKTAMNVAIISGGNIDPALHTLLKGF